MDPLQNVPHDSYVDAHVHLADVNCLSDVARAGISAVRDAGSTTGAGLTAAKGAGDGHGVTVRSAGWALYREGGYGSRIGRPFEDVDMERQILALRQAGADIIKVIASGMVSLKQPGMITPGGLSGEALRMVVQTARVHGMDVMAHANGAEAITASIDAGVRSIEHGFFMTADLLDRMKDKSVFWVPTVGALVRAAAAAGATSEVRTFINRTIRGHLDLLRRAFTLGVPLAIGTDCVLPDPQYGDRYQEELAHFRAAGIPPVDVERIAREGGRLLLGLSDRR